MRKKQKGRRSGIARAESQEKQAKEEEHRECEGGRERGKKEEGDLCPSYG